jgi:hypothetical protein
VSLGPDIRRTSQGHPGTTVAQPEEADALLEMLGFASQLGTACRHFLGSSGILLNHSIQLRDGTVDLLSTSILFAGRRTDLLYEISGLLDIRNEIGQRLPPRWAVSTLEPDNSPPPTSVATKATGERHMSRSKFASAAFT